MEAESCLACAAHSLWSRVLRGLFAVLGRGAVGRVYLHGFRQRDLFKRHDILENLDGLAGERALA